MRLFLMFLNQQKINSEVVVYYGATISGLNPQNFSLKNFLYFFLKKPALKKFLIFSQKNFTNFQEAELSYIFFKKVFLIFRERYIQKPGKFRTRSLIRTLVYSES